MLASLFCVFLAADSGFVFVPSPDAGLNRLATWVRDRSAGAVSDLLPGDVAIGAIAQSDVYANPELRLDVGNIAVGPTTPPGLRLFDQVMSYSAGLSFKLEIDKRGHRQARARFAAVASKAAYAGALRQRALALAQTLGTLALTQLELQALAEAAPAGESALLRLEAAQQQGRRAEIAAEQARALVDCSRAMSLRCAPFASAQDARAFLEAWISGRLEGTSTDGKAAEGRWDVRELEASAKAQQEALGLAKAQSYPDPVLSLDYVHDRFIAGFHNMNTFNVGVRIPLPFFDRAQGAEKTAAATGEHLKAQRERVLVASREVIAQLDAALHELRKRFDALTRDTVPAARAALAEIEREAKAGHMAQGELALGRRTLRDVLSSEIAAIEAAFFTKLALLLEVGE